MKLRVRSMATKATIRTSAPDTSSLLDLKSLIAASLAADSTNPNPIAPDSIHLSLNRTDELIAPNPGDPLSALGITSGDLLFFSFSAFRGTPAIGNPPQIANSIPTASSSGSNSSSNNLIPNPNTETTENPSIIGQLTGPMEVDTGSAVLEKSDNAHSIPDCLKELLDAKSDEDASILGRVVVLTHAALLNMGFTLLNGDGLRLSRGLASHASSFFLEYTIPHFAGQVKAINEKVVMKLSVLGNLATIYGYMVGIKPDFYRFCFDLAKVATLLSLDLNSMSISEQAQLMEIFRGVKDRLALPLMIDLCLKNGLPLPPCFMSLTADIRAKILDLLPGLDVLRVGSTCKDMRNLSLDDNLWRQKIESEFVNSLNDSNLMSSGTWKERYKKAYIAKNRVIRMPRNLSQIRYSPLGRTYFGQPPHYIMGGDAYREYGGDPAARLYQRRPAYNRDVSPRCDFQGMI